MRTILAVILLAGCTVSGWAAGGPKKSKPLYIYFLDVEGGQSTLVVSPSGASLLIDAGWPGNKDRDAERIAAAAKDAHISKIDYLVVTHYHTDHVGGVPQLLAKLPVGTFIDHGPNTENGQLAPEGYKTYLETIESKPRVIATPGMHIPTTGFDVEVVSSAGKVITSPLPGAGQPNPYCATEPMPEDDATENAASVGMIVRYGDFRFADFGDLTRNKERLLVCPANLLGTVDLFLVSHHGFNWSNSRVMVHALHPRVAVSVNSFKKGGDADVWQTVHDSPGLEGFWQLHYAEAAGPKHNVSPEFLANIEGGEDGHWIKVTAWPSGTFTVLNSRTGHKVTYRKAPAARRD